MFFVSEMRTILFLFLLRFVSFCCMYLYFMLTTVSYHMFFRWCSFMYPHWGFWNKPLDLTWIELQQRPKSPTLNLTWHASKYKRHKRRLRYSLCVPVVEFLSLLAYLLACQVRVIASDLSLSLCGVFRVLSSSSQVSVFCSFSAV